MAATSISMFRDGKEVRLSLVQCGRVRVAEIKLCRETGTFLSPSLSTDAYLGLSAQFGVGACSNSMFEFSNLVISCPC